MLKNKEKIELPSGSEEKYITLKEASEISEYAPDYIGQLIRAGKIEGKQVYSNVAWVTTEVAIRAYMEGRGKASEETESENFIEEKAPKIAQWLLSIVIGASAVFLVILLYIFAVNLDHRLTKTYVEDAQTQI